MTAENGHSITLPGWFLKVMAGATAIFTGLFIPWAVWLTATMMQVSFKVDNAQALSVKQDKTDERLNELDKRLLLNRVETSEITRRLDALEKKP
jgi:hypothetical protein